MEFDRPAYVAGLKEGNAEYCTGQNGFQIGLSGVKSEKVCMSDSALAFEDGQNAGRKLRRAVLNLDQSNYQKELDLIGNAITHARYYRVQQALANNRGNDDQTRDLRSMEAELISRHSTGSDRRITRLVRTPDLIEKCEEAKRSAEEKGYYTSISCL